MARRTPYQEERDWAKYNPGLPPEFRKWAAAVDAKVTWGTTTTSTSTTSSTSSSSSSTTTTTTA